MKAKYVCVYAPERLEEFSDVQYVDMSDHFPRIIISEKCSEYTFVGLPFMIERDAKKESP